MPVKRHKQSRSPASAAARLLDADSARTGGPRLNALGWILEALESDPGYLHRRMFGCDAAYVGGLLCLVTATKREPWNGLLVATSLDRHALLREEWPELAPHKILGKWLYVSQDHADFEPIVLTLVHRVLARDPRIGVEPKPRKRKQAQRRPKRPAGKRASG